MPEFDKLPPSIVLMLMAASAVAGLISAVVVGWFKLKSNRLAVVSGHELAFMDKIMAQVAAQDSLIAQLRAEQITQRDYYENALNTRDAKYEKMLAEQELKCHAELAKLRVMLETKQEKY